MSDARHGANLRDERCGQRGCCGTYVGVVVTDGQVAGDHGRGVAIGLGVPLVEAATNRVAHHERAGDHRRAEHDREGGQGGAELACGEAAENDGGHRAISFIASRISADAEVGVLGDHEAVGEEQHAIGLGGRAGVVRDHHHGATEVAGRVAQELQHLGGRAGVEVARGLVGEHDGRLGDERPGDGDALLLTAGELGGPVAAPIGEADTVEQVEDARLICRAGATGEPDRQGDVLLGREGGE